MKPNREEEYPVFFHMIHPAEVLKISVFGDIELSYFGFGDESKTILKGAGASEAPSHSKEWVVCKRYFQT